MPTVTLEGKDAVLVSLAMQKEATLKQQAAQAFASDVALVVADLGATGAVSFKIDGGQVTAEWPDEGLGPYGQSVLDLEMSARREYMKASPQLKKPEAPCRWCSHAGRDHYAPGDCYGECRCNGYEAAPIWSTPKDGK